MAFQRRMFLSILVCSIFAFGFSSCRNRGAEGSITIALPNKFSTLDTLSATGSDSAADRLRTLIYNSLVKKNDKFEYVGDLAKEVKIGEDNLTIMLVLNDNVKFHNGKPLTSADAKYTFDALFQVNGYKAGSFFDTAPDETDPEKKKTKKVPHITSIETPDAKTIVFKVGRPALVNQLLSNLVAIPIIPEGSVEQQKTQPVGTGPFKFVSFDQLSSQVELLSNQEYWEGAPKIQKLTVKTVTDSNSLQAELQSGRVDIVPNPDNFSADTFKLLAQNPNIQVVKSDGSNIRYIGFNLQNKQLNNVKLRQAVAYAIDREKIIKELLDGQAKAASSIIAEQSWAYSPGTVYSYDLAKAKQLVQESGYKGEKIVFKIAGGNQAVGQYSQIIQTSLKEAGINAEIETVDSNTLTDQLKKGQFDMNTAIWVGGNQDPIFLRDLFLSSEAPSDARPNGRNRARYSNPEFDKVVMEAVNEPNRDKAKPSYVKAQEIISNDLPLFPLWYPSNMVIANKKIGNININPSGDWSFVKDLTVN